MRIENIIFILLINVALAQDSIINTDKILKNNEALVIDAKTNKVAYILEISKDEKIIKKYPNKAKLDLIKKELNFNNIQSQYTKNATSKSLNDKVSKRINTKSNISNWNKKTIIYEQKVYRIEIPK